MLNTEIFKECKNYKDIVNYNYNKEDYITENIINVYQEQIFNNKEQNIEKIKILDTIVMKYIKDRDFYDFVRKYYLEDKSTYFTQDDLKLIELNDKYKILTQTKDQPRWI